MPTRRDSARVASIGVTRTQLYVEEELGWLFREQPTEDYGIDAHVEIVDKNNEVRGRLLALQIKSGESWFAHPTPEGWWYRPDDDHVKYWTNHSLPVIVILYRPSSRLCYWQLISTENLEKTSNGGWRLLVPSSNLLNAEAATLWRVASDGDPYEMRLRELRLALPWMRMLRKGKRLVVDFEEWVNKTSGKGKISIGIDSEAGGEPDWLVDWHLLVGPLNYAEEVPTMFAWADMVEHEETYQKYAEEFHEHEHELWIESGCLVGESFDDWLVTRRATGIQPYRNGAGEVDFYRLELNLSELGKSFLIVDDFANFGRRQMIRQR